MARFTHFSHHALKRLSERTNMSCFELADMLDHHGAVSSGKTAIFEKIHWVFYSKPDNACFVAIQDKFTGKVITILTLEYHETLAWKISDDIQMQAVERANSFCAPKNNGNHPSKVIFSASYEDEEGNQKTKTLFKRNINDYDGYLENVLNCDSLEAEIESSCKKKGINPNYPFSVLIRLGNDSSPMIIKWNEELHYEQKAKGYFDHVAIV